MNFTSQEGSYLREGDFTSGKVNFASQKRVLPHERTFHTPERGFSLREGVFYITKVDFPSGKVNFTSRGFYLRKKHFSPQEGGTLNQKMETTSVTEESFTS